MTEGKRGRQAEARRNDSQLLEAARLVIATLGPDAPVSAIAAEAGVGIASLYRRYSTKEDLLRYLCVESMHEQIEAATFALADGRDPESALTTFIRRCVGFRAGAFSSIAGSVTVTPEMTATARRAHDLIDKLVAKACSTGGLRPDVTSADIIGLIAFFSRRHPGEDQTNDRLLSIMIDGLRAGLAAELPHGGARWRHELTEQWTTEAR